MGARVDKVDSKDVVRAILNADVASGSWNKVLGVGINSSGKLVVGAGQSGVIGVAIFDKYNSKAGNVVDVFDTAEVILSGSELLAAGTVYTLLTTTGAIGSTAADSTHVRCGYTVENDRLIVRMG